MRCSEKLLRIACEEQRGSLRRLLETGRGSGTIRKHVSSCKLCGLAVSKTADLQIKHEVQTVSTKLVWDVLTAATLIAVALTLLNYFL